MCNFGLFFLKIIFLRLAKWQSSRNLDLPLPPHTGFCHHWLIFMKTRTLFCAPLRCQGRRPKNNALYPITFQYPYSSLLPSFHTKPLLLWRCNPPPPLWVTLACFSLEAPWWATYRSPKDTWILIPGSVNVTFMVEKAFTSRIKLKILRWEMILAYPSGL